MPVPHNSQCVVNKIFKGQRIQSMFRNSFNGLHEANLTKENIGVDTQNSTFLSPKEQNLDMDIKKLISKQYFFYSFKSHKEQSTLGHLELNQLLI